MVPTGWYSVSLAIGVILGAILAFTGRDRRLRWPAGAMLLSLVAARAATAFPGAALGILLVITPACVWLCLVPGLRTPWAAPSDAFRAANVISALYVPRLLCYAANAFSLLDRAMMWEFSNFFLIIQIGALFAGVIGGGHRVFDLLGSGDAAGGRDDLLGTPAARRSSQPPNGRDF